MKLQEIVNQRQVQKSTNPSSRYQGAIDYKGEKIAQWHNPKIMIDDILGENDTKQFSSIMIIGTPGTGKTTLSNFISHEIHTKDPSYLVINFGKKELLKFDKVMETLPNRNLILKFDDVSLVFKHIKDPEQKTRILQTLTEIRHPQFEDTDRKVIVIANVHYQNALEKMWRSQGGWKIYTDMTTEEMQVFNAMTKGKFKKKIDIFASTTLQQFRKKQFTVSLTVREQRTYVTNKPFRFVMCYDSSTIRFFLVPSEVCNLCDPKANLVKKEKVYPREIINLMKKYYGKDGTAGLKLALNEVGEQLQYRNRTIRAKAIAKEILATFDTDKEELAKVMRTDARIPGTANYTIRKKRTDFFKDIADMRNNEGKITFATDVKEDVGELDLDLDL